MSLRTHRMVSNAAWLYGARFITYAFPLLNIPRLSHVLGTEAWGHVVFAQAISLLLSLLVDFGFGVSATREVARHRDDKTRLREILGSVLGIRLLLSLLLGVVFAVLVLTLPPDLPLQRGFMLGTLSLAVAQGCNMGWFFQGTERMAILALSGATVYAVNTVGIFTLIATPGDGWIVLALQATLSGLEVIFLLTLVWRRLGVVLPNPLLAAAAFHMGRGTFIYRLIMAAQASANSVALGAITPGAAVGIFAGADKFNKVLAVLVSTAGDVVYPRLNHLMRHSHADAAQFNRLTAQMIIAGGCIAAGLLEIVAGELLPRLLGAAFAASVPVFRILVMALPFTCVTACLGAQWMLALRRERDLNLVLGCGVLLNIGLSLVLAPRYGAIGVAVAVTASEICIAATILFVLSTCNLLPSQTHGDPAMASPK